MPVMAVVMIGVDPHKASHTAVAINAAERVLDVPPKLAARVRLLATGNVNKNDPNDARSVAVAALRSAQVREARRDDYAAVLKVWPRALPGPGPDAYPGGLPAAPGAVRAGARRR